MFSLKNKVALVVGGTGKIGFEISCALASQGAQVIAANRSGTFKKSQENKFKDNKIELVKMDASNEEDVQEIVDKIYNNEGRIDILVNASAWRPLSKFMDDTVENWEKSIKSNSLAIFIPSRIIGKKMAEAREGSIINISSIYGISGPPMSIYEDCDFETEPDYPFLKSGCIGFSKYLSSYFAKDNVRVNVIAPGGVFNNQPKGFTDRYEEMTPMKRMASPRDIVGAVVYFASDTSSYVTGTVLPIDGGWTAV